MTQIAVSRESQLARIALLLHRSAESLASDDAGIAILGELMEVWARLTDGDRRDVLALAVNRAERVSSEKLSEAIA